jgi:UDP-N-acetylglucosamine diphosphorylase/glucosamine-1-phosphate N-acetyltransferase
MHLPTHASTRPCVFFDDARGVIGPLTDLRASFEVRTGALTTAQRLAAALALDPVAVYAPPGLGPLVATRWSVPVNTLPDAPPSEPILVVNGRCTLPLDVLSDIEPGMAAVEEHSGDLVCARLDAAEVVRLMAGENPAREIITIHDRVLLARPWDVIATRDRAIDIDLAILLGGPARDPSDAVTVLGENPVRVDPAASIAPGAVLDATAGPVVIEHHATLRPGAIIIGPAVVGPSSTVAEHAVIRAHTAVGPVCKVGGEIAGAIFQAYSNKAHDGFVGDSWIGEWVNLGAGTTTSNLLNTYSEISAVAERGMSRERTGLTFFGCVLGDHTKTAIGTRIMTGSIVHTGAMWAATEPISECVDRFAWSTNAGDKRFRLPRFFETMDAMMARRDQSAGPVYRARIESLHNAPA